MLSEMNIDENEGSSGVGLGVPGKEQWKPRNTGVKLLAWMGNYIQFSTAKGVRREGQEMTEANHQGLYSTAGQLKFHPKGKGAPPKGPRSI